MTLPYIRKERRYELEAPGELLNNAGELNYRLTLEVLRYVGDNPSYLRFNDAVGALECAKMELYRRMVVPYEDGKIRENGDVYPHPKEPQTTYEAPHECLDTRCHKQNPHTGRCFT